MNIKGYALITINGLNEVAKVNDLAKTNGLTVVFLDSALELPDSVASPTEQLALPTDNPTKVNSRWSDEDLIKLCDMLLDGNHSRQELKAVMPERTYSGIEYALRKLFKTSSLANITTKMVTEARNKKLKKGGNK